MASAAFAGLCALFVLASLVACQREAPEVVASPPTAPAAVPGVAAPTQTPVASDDVVSSLRTARDTVATLARGAEAALGQTPACVAQNKNVAARSIAVHRWIDAAGITHYSDQPPAAGVHDHRVIEVQGLPAIAVQATGNDVNLPDRLQQRAVTDALGVQRVMRDVLGVGAPMGLTLHVVFVQSPETYARLIGEPALAASAGAYSTGQHTIYVRMQAREEASFAVLRHEITHALVHESIGNLPTPVNEGMAEYFGRYRVSGLGGEVDVGADRDVLKAAAPGGDEAEALVDLLARDGNSFYAEDAGAGSRERRYVRAYALVAFLMRRESERSILAAVLAEQRADPCQPVAVEKVLDRRYAGGLRALSTAWAGFMRDPPAGIQSY